MQIRERVTPLRIARLTPRERAHNPTAFPLLDSSSIHRGREDLRLTEGYDATNPKTHRQRERATTSPQAKRTPCFVAQKSLRFLRPTFSALKESATSLLQSNPFDFVNPNGGRQRSKSFTILRTISPPSQATTREILHLDYQKKERFSSVSIWQWSQRNPRKIAHTCIAFIGIAPVSSVS